jgi:small subunit ribosomal protein S6
MLIKTDATEEKFKVLEKAIEDILKKVDGKTASFDKWGKYKLAYPIQKQSYGIYVLSRYELPDDKASAFFKDFDINIKVRHADFLMRHVNVALTPEQAAAEYKKPTPIDENESVVRDRRIMAMSNQNLGLDGDELDSGASDGEVLDISRLSLDSEEEN